MSYQTEATDARLKVLELIYNAQTSHIGSNFSCIDILTVLFDKIDLDKDKFVLSKGWAAASLYYFLWKKGRITEEQLDSFCKEGSEFIGLAEPITKDIPISGGSMGLGFPGAVGLALAKKLKKEEGVVYCLMSDGELAIGTTWEASLIAGHHRLDNLVVIVDDNGFQAMGKTADILDASFPMTRNWRYDIIDGHNFQEIEDILNRRPLLYPGVIMAKTTKGRGVSFMENENIYHYKQLSEEEYLGALTELHG